MIKKNLLREGARVGEFFANEITGGDMRDAEELGEAAGVGALADARAAQENPLNISVLGSFTREIVVLKVRFDLRLRRCRSRRVKVYRSCYVSEEF